MRTSLLNGKTVDAKDFTWEQRYLPFKCPECGKQLFLVDGGDFSYYNFFRHKSGETCISYKKKYSQEEYDNFEKITDIKMLMLCNDDPESLTLRQRRKLRARGLIYPRRMCLTDKALKMLEEVYRDDKLSESIWL